MTPISNLNLTVSDGSTIASTEIYGADKKTYINIGSGNVFRLSWTTPILTGDTVDRYSLVIKRHDTTLNVYYDIFDKNIGLVNEFYVDSSLLSTLPTQYMLSIYVVAYGKLGSVVTSNVVNPYISKGTGTYVKVTPDGYAQPIMKRALAFVNEPTQDVQVTAAIRDNSGNIVPLYDSNGNTVQPTATRILTSTDWSVTQEGYIKDDKGTWQPVDIKYETLLVLKEGTSDVYEIAKVQQEGNPLIYEPIYVL